MIAFIFQARRLRAKSKLGGQGSWQVEVGETGSDTTVNVDIKENGSNVSVCLVRIFSHSDNGYTVESQYYEHQLISRLIGMCGTDSRDT